MKKQMNQILPEYIDTQNFKNIVLDNMCISSYIVNKLPQYVSFMQVMNDIPENYEYDIAMHIKKQDIKKVLNDITYNIAQTGSEIKTTNKNQIDIDIMHKTKTDAEKIRQQIQINNEEIYKMYMYFTLFTKLDNKDKFPTILKSFESKLYSKQIIVNAANFRQLDAYMATLPICRLDKNLMCENYKYLTTTNVAYLFAFASNSIFDKNGIIFGINSFDNSIIAIDIFSNKYTNANMCVLGSSGSGKSYFIKLSIIRQYFCGINQYVFDPESEYTSIAQKFDGVVIDFKSGKTRYNIFSFNYFEIEMSDFLNVKIQKILDFLNYVIDFTDFQRQVMYQCIKNAYFKKGINEEKENVYEKLGDNDKIYIHKKIKSGDKIINFEDVFKEINEYIKMQKKINKQQKEEINRLKTKFKLEILEKLNFLNNKSSNNLNNNLIVFNFSNIDSNISALLVRYFLDLIYSKLKYDTMQLEKQQANKSVIYIDEVWKYISTYNEYKLDEYIFMLYKTIRKLNASIITITQDISDFFETNKGSYGKSILNNCAFRIFFKLNFSDTTMLQQIGVLDLDKTRQLYRLNKGQANVFFNYSNVIINVHSSEFEEKIIQGAGINDNSSNE